MLCLLLHMAQLLCVPAVSQWLTHNCVLDFTRCAKAHFRESKCASDLVFRIKDRVQAQSSASQTFQQDLKPGGEQSETHDTTTDLHLVYSWV